MLYHQHIADLADLLKRHGFRHAVICPGSRNAPLIQVLHRDPHFLCHSIVDERSAGYVALGISKMSGEGVVVVTTSGTAAVNVAPAVAEAFFQNIPLVVLTADRPQEWPQQFNNQIVRQDELYIRNSKAFLFVPAAVADEGERAVLIADMSRVLLTALTGQKGPVHLNLLLREPIYAEVAPPLPYNLPPGNPPEELPTLTAEERELISGALATQKNVLIIAGMHPYTDAERSVLEALATACRVVVIAENIANLPSAHFIASPDVVLGSLTAAGQLQLTPDLVIAFGGQVVSKRARLFVQGLKGVPLIVMDQLPLSFFNEVLTQVQPDGGNEYLARWKNQEQEAFERAERFLDGVPYSNLAAMRRIVKALPGETVVHLGNSGTVRYSQLMAVRSDLVYMGNRGTSGIDGSLSTAVGAALVSDRLHVAILGDLSFVYDSNALWNSHFPKNLRIIVLNDNGGGIFRLIDGPSTMPFFEEFSVTHHPVKMGSLAAAFGLQHRLVKNFSELDEALELLFDPASDLAVVEADTAGCENSRIFKEFFKSIQNPDHANT